MALVATPFDVIKTRLIAQTLHTHDRSCFYKYCEGVINDACLSCGYEHSPQYVYRGLCQRQVYAGTLDAVSKIVRNEGLPALWNGTTPTLVMVVPAAVTYFTMFDFMKQQGRCVLHERYHHLVPSCAGLTARIVNVGIFSPIELIRTKAQSEHLLSYGKLKDSIGSHIKANGIKSLWDGAKSQLFRDLPFTVVYWYLQDGMKVRLNKRGYDTLSSNFIGAFVGASVASLISHPFDLTKVQIQSNIGKNTGSDLSQIGLADHLRNIARTDGFRGLFVGLTPRMFKIMPSCAIFITTFEGLKEYFNKNNPKDSNY